ncbi:MAG: toprim domain-containing protein, partial [candidate division WOR-3 bacterium]
LTENQALLLSRYARKANILFDGDLSGIKAALRAIGILINAQVEVHIVLLPEECDPDEFIKEKGRDALENLVSTAPDFFTFYRQVSKISSVEDEANLIKELIEIISKIQDPIRLDRYLKHTSQVFDIPVDILRKKIGINFSAKKPIEKETKKKTITPNPEEKLIILILNNLKYIDKAKDIISVDDFNDAGIKNIYSALLKNADFSVQKIVDLKIEEELKNRLLASLIETEKLREEEFIQSLNFYKKNLLRAKLKSKISEAIRSGDEESLKKFKELLKK